MKLFFKLSLYLSLLTSFNLAWAEHVQLLIKLPSRERASRFFEVLDLYYANLSQKVSYQFLISGDLDDTGPNGLNTPSSLARLNNYPHLSYYFGPRINKIEAVNRDLDKHPDFEVLLVASDDMVPVVFGYDQIILNNMQQHFPDLDGTLNFHDGIVGQSLSTIPIMGQKYYQRYQYVYHPDYFSICCDLEATLLAQMQSKEFYSNQIIIRHEHASAQQNSKFRDPLFYHNESQSYYRHDSQLLYKRHANNFGLNLSQILPKYWLTSSLDLFNYQNTPVKLSILIATIDKRQEQFTKLYCKLLDQIKQSKLEHQVEVLFFKDDQTIPLGAKRNQLVAQAKGEYVCFLDDDDDVCDQYVRLIYQALITRPDCVSCTGILYRPGRTPKTFVHSLKYQHAFNKKNIACSPVYHLNPIKRSIAILAKFPEQNYNEDTVWAKQIQALNLLKKEVEIKQPYYFYHYDYQKSEAIPEAAKHDRRIKWKPNGELTIKDLAWNI